MNFLAHAYLSGNNDEILIGNFIADAVKGKQTADFNANIQKGIQLHRSIDAYTDQHPVFLRSKERIHEKYGRYAGVVIDIYYDHFLARKWNDYSDESLSEFALHVYRLMLENYRILPPMSKRILPYMTILNWLVGYARFKDLQRVFNGMSRRSKQYNSGMEGAVETLKAHYNDFDKDFRLFFPDMIQHASEVRSNLLS